MPALTSALVASIEDLRAEIASGLLFPVMAIPFGADETTPCRFFLASDEVAAKDLEDLLEHAHKTPDGVRTVHLVHSPRTGIANFTPDSTFYLVQT